MLPLSQEPRGRVGSKELTSTGITLNTQIPPLNWARLTDPKLGEGLIVFTFFDRRAGLSCKGFGAGSEDAAILAERPAWLKHYGQQPKHWGSWFNDPMISALLNPDYPCDLLVMFPGLPEEDNVPSEEMWVRLFDREDDSNQTHTAPSARHSHFHRASYLDDLYNSPSLFWNSSNTSACSFNTLSGIRHLGGYFLSPIGLY